MHEYQLEDAENKFNEHHEESYRPYEQDSNRPRPMTTADYQSPESRKHAHKHGGIDFGLHGNFPAVEGTRAVSAKAYKGPEKLLSPNSRKMAEKQQSYGNLGGKNQAFGLQNNKLVTTPSANTLKIPKNIMQDKERLYEETLHLKEYVNALKEENLKLKTKINNLEKEASKFEKMIQEANTTYYKEVAPTKAAESHLTLTLKQNIKDLKNTMKKRDEELSEIKKSMKYTKVQELEVQLKAFQDEASRLRTVMDHIMSEKAQIVMSDDDKNRLQEEYFVQATQVKTLKRDNEEMATAIKILEEQNFEYEKKLSEQDKKFKREQNQNKKLLQEKEKEINKLKSEGTGGAAIGGTLAQHSVLKRPMTSSNRDDALRQELDKKTIENNNLINQLAEKRNQVLALERQLRDLKSDFNEKVTSAQNEKQALLRELEKQKNAKASGPVEAAKGQGGHELKVQELKLDDYVRRASLQRSFSEEEKDKLLFGAAAKTVNQPEKKEQKTGGVPKKRVQKVRPEDVKKLGYELNLRLRIKRLTFEEIDRAIWSEKIRKTGMVTIKDMIDILKNEPFDMTKEDEIILCSRFLVEENEHEYLYYDENAKNELQIVRSILKKMIGNLPPWDEVAIRKMHEDITAICVDNYGGLRENLKALCKSGFLTAKDLREACNLVEVSITEEQIEYVIMKLFECSDDITKLAIDKLFEVFSHKYLKEEFGKAPSQVNLSKRRESEGPDNEEYKQGSMNQDPMSKHSIREAHHHEEEDEEEDDGSPVQGQDHGKGRFEDGSEEQEGSEEYQEDEEEQEEGQGDEVKEH